MAKVEMIGNEAKAEATRRGLRQKDIAVRYGCTENRLSCILAQRVVTEGVAKRLADAIGVPMSQITRPIDRG